MNCLCDNMKVYVAGKWASVSVINSVQEKLRLQGHTITHDWTSFTPEQELEYDTRRAILDANGVKAADVVFAIMTDKQYAYQETFTEIGCALGLDKEIIIVCPDDDYYCASNCFFRHPFITHVKTVEEGLNGLRDRPTPVIFGATNVFIMKY